MDARMDIDGLRTRLGGISTSDATDILLGLGYTKIVMAGIDAQVPAKGAVVGRARTLRLLPEREDQAKAGRGAVHRDLYESLSEGDILVVDALANTSVAVFGDMMFSRFEARKAAAVVVDGMVRDIPTVRDGRFPIFARGSVPRLYPGTLRPWDADCAIHCGGVLVMPGDWILADTDGIVVIPASAAVEVVKQAESRRPTDAFSAALLAAGFPLDDAYPLADHMKQFVGAFANEGTMPDREAAAKLAKR